MYQSMRGIITQSICSMIHPCHAVSCRRFTMLSTLAYKSVQVGAMKQMGVRMTDTEAAATVSYYDLKDTGEMDYEVNIHTGYPCKTGLCLLCGGF